MQQSDGLRAAIYGIVWYAAALHLVTLAALLAAGMLFAVDDLATIRAVVSGLSIAIWGGAVLILLVVGLISLVRWLGQAPPADPLHDVWMDEQGSI
jgi:hypothetical protein